MTELYFQQLPSLVDHLIPTPFYLWPPEFSTVIVPPIK